jgi:hypothetical protein
MPDGLFVALFRSHSRITTLDLSMAVIGSQTLKEIGGLKRLQTLHLRLVGESQGPPSTAGGYFHNLEHLNVGAECQSSFTRFLEILGSPKLLSLKVERTSALQPWNTASLIQTLHSNCPHSSLRCLEVIDNITYSLWNPDRPTKDWTPISLSSIETLLSFRSLARLTLCQGMENIVHDKMADIITDSWPSMEKIVMHLYRWDKYPVEAGD